MIDIKCGFHHNIALTESGRIYGWGLNNYGQLGVNNRANQYSAKRAFSMPNLSNIVQIECGINYTWLDLMGKRFQK